MRPCPAIAVECSSEFLKYPRRFSGNRNNKGKKYRQDQDAIQLGIFTGRHKDHKNGQQSGGNLTAPAGKIWVITVVKKVSQHAREEAKNTPDKTPASQYRNSIDSKTDQKERRQQNQKTRKKQNGFSLWRNQNHNGKNQIGVKFRRDAPAWAVKSYVAKPAKGLNEQQISDERVVLFKENALLAEGTRLNFNSPMYFATSMPRKIIR